MPTVQQLPVLNLKLDPKNYRHLPQKSEEKALHAMAALDTPYFWGLCRGLLKKGYVEIENIVVLKSTPTDDKPVVKEGNRRIGIIKLALGQLKGTDLEIPDDVRDLLKEITPKWREKNSDVPCLVFEPSEEDGAKEVVDIAHGKAEMAARLEWNAVARARHNRDNGAAEPALDLLEKYIKSGTNLSVEQKERWSAKYHLTVLEEALSQITDRLGFASVPELVKAYPTIVKHRAAIDKILYDVGMESLGFPTIRDKQIDFAVVRYDIPLRANPNVTSAAPTPIPVIPSSPTTQITPTPPTSTSSGVPASLPTSRQIRAVPLEDARAVTRKLKSFHPVGKNREKLVSLLEEARKLKVGEHRFSFCFVLRSMFEISAKAYIKDNPTAGIKLNKPDGKERPLRDVLIDVVNHLTDGSKNLEMDKFLHGSQTELTKKKGILSIDSLNQLIHNLDFTISETDLCCVFANVFPLLQAMNR